MEVAARLVNELTPGHRRGRPYDAPAGRERVRATAAALGGDGRRTPEVSDADAVALAGHAAAMRTCFQACDAGQDDDLARAAATVNAMLRATGARPQLDALPGGGWHVHFHGRDDSLAVGWAAGCATGLALAMGSDLAGRLGVCAAERCDRVYVDTSKNSTRRFCSTSCQNRVKAAAYRARR
ncbi:CGNR zinc finger domain-containing protein [Nocardioides rubriscoriae]|uniref:CGNR zinc finger domain-containing protein n=1 Tax=Nocardioides rubriscoriae TaxID=642762 RepID=UPI001FE91C94|nr:CGNR zinc finger domain-containing protein [Nocardioides rubriscoriae]